jgi:formamidopyrimidine-DNA glycosylase
VPELPELEIVREVLTRRVVGRMITGVEVAAKGGPIVIRDLTGRGFSTQLTGSTIAGAERRGKFLLFAFDSSDLRLAINPKLSGRLQLCAPGAKKAGPVQVTLHLSDPHEELRYIDSKMMGQLYLTQDLAGIPTFAEMGPDALAVDTGTFQRRLRSFRGEMKGILVREQFLAGIGNAYADEILWAAQLHPYRKRSSLDGDEIDRLYGAVRTTLADSIEKVRKEMGENIHLKPRAFFAVHLRGGEPCPRCGTAISAVTANQRITNFCRTCQPGGLTRGM